MRINRFSREYPSDSPLSALRNSFSSSSRSSTPSSSSSKSLLKNYRKQSFQKQHQDTTILRRMSIIERKEFIETIQIKNTCLICGDIYHSQSDNYDNRRKNALKHVACKHFCKEIKHHLLQQQLVRRVTDPYKCPECGLLKKNYLVLANHYIGDHNVALEPYWQFTKFKTTALTQQLEKQQRPFDERELTVSKE